MFREFIRLYKFCASRGVLPGMEWTVTLWLAARVNNRKALTNTVFAVKIFYVL